MNKILPNVLVLLVAFLISVAAPQAAWPQSPQDNGHGPLQCDNMISVNSCVVRGDKPAVAYLREHCEQNADWLIAEWVYHGAVDEDVNGASFAFIRPIEDVGQQCSEGEVLFTCFLMDRRFTECPFAF